MCRQAQAAASLWPLPCSSLKRSSNKLKCSSRLLPPHRSCCPVRMSNQTPHTCLTRTCLPAPFISHFNCLFPCLLPAAGEQRTCYIPGSTNPFWKGPDSKYLRLCEHYGLSLTRLELTHRQHINEWVGLCSNKTLFMGTEIYI